MPMNPKTMSVTSGSLYSRDKNVHETKRKRPFSLPDLANDATFCCICYAAIDEFSRLVKLFSLLL